MTEQGKMQYNFRHQRWQTYVLKFPNYYLSRLSWASKHLSKLSLILVPLLSYSVNTQALSSTMAGQIHGSAPYLTFDNGVTKVTTTEGLLGITLSDDTRITPATNTSTAGNPIRLPEDNQSFADIGMLVPTTTNSINLKDLIGAPYNYWGDDDGDGQGANGITVSGRLSVSITNKINQAVSRSATLDLCNAPYKMVLTSTAGSLTTQYGLPNSSSFSGSTATYYISPKAKPKICSVRPSLNDGVGDNAGPADIWSPTKGFLVQSTESSSYSRNFPTTGANNLHFDLLAAGVDAATLTWPAVTQGGITATMTFNPPKDDSFNPDGASSVRVTLTGSTATSAQINSASPGSVVTPTLPQTFELVGYDSNNKAVIKYGFVLKQWFVNRGSKYDTYYNHSSWCSNIGGGYRMPQVKDLTNAKCGVDSSFPCVNGIDGATPLSTVNTYQRNIGAGLFTEWGNMGRYTAAGFANSSYWTSDRNDLDQFAVYSYNGHVSSNYPGHSYDGVCTYP